MTMGNKKIGIERVQSFLGTCQATAAQHYKGTASHGAAVHILHSTNTSKHYVGYLTAMPGNSSPCCA